MDNYTVKITQQAREHLRSIRHYIETELSAPEAAKNTLAALRKEIKGLAEMPGRIKLTEEEPWHSEGIHRMHVRNHYVYFWIDEANRRVQVTSVVYVARNQAVQLKRMKINE